MMFRPKVYLRPNLRPEHSGRNCQIRSNPWRPLNDYRRNRIPHPWRIFGDFHPVARCCRIFNELGEKIMGTTFTLNGKSTTVDVDPQMPLLWVLRDTLNMTRTKFGCGMALCGACTVHINGEATRSCITPASSVAGKKIPQ